MTASSGLAVVTGSTAVRARAAVRVDLVDGRVQLTTVRSDVPLVLRRTGDDPAPGGSVPGLTVHLVAAAGGPLAGDDLRLDIDVGPGVRLTVRSAGATVALPGHGAGPSRMHVEARVGAGARLEYLPEPTVAAAGCRHRMSAAITLAPDATLLWREEILLGRHGEAPGDIESCLQAEILADTGGLQAGDGHARPLLRHDLRLGPGQQAVAGAAVLGGARAVGSLLVAGPGPGGLGATPSVVTDPSGRTVASAMPLAGPGVLVLALADDAVTLRRRLAQASTDMPG